MSLVGSLRAASPRAQLLAVAGVLVVLAAAMTGAYFAWFHQPYGVLFANLRTQDAAAIVAELDKRKVPYRIKDGGRTILAPAKVVDATRLSVMSADLPLKGGVGYEIFNKSDMGLTEFAQSINYRRALQGELARTIMALDSVDSARVHLSLAEPSVFREDRRPSKASITVIPRPGQVVPGSAVRGIQRLVAGAVPDLDPADVVIVDERGDVLTGVEPATAPIQSPAVQEKAAVEAYYEGRARMAILGVWPADQARVLVSAGAAPAVLGDAASDPFRAWTPAARSFPLSVTVSAPGPVAPEVRERVERLVREALGPGAPAGDTITFGPPPATAELAPPPPVAAPAPAPAAALPSIAAPGSFWVAVLAPALLLLLLLAWLLQRPGRGPARLSPQDRARYAERLKSLLEREEADAARS